MTALLDSLGPAILRASWQAAVLAVVVALLVRSFGDRLAPRWRFLLWGVVLARLLLVVTPISPWSAFNLTRWTPEPGSNGTARNETGPAFVPPADPSIGTFISPTQPTAPNSTPEPAVVRAQVAAGRTVVTEAPRADVPRFATRFESISLARVLTAAWLVGCAVLAVKLLATVLVLRRRLSACRPVTDPRVLELLEICRTRLGLRRTPGLLVTPEALSPCLVGTWSPRIVLPESLVANAAPSRLQHVLAHELAHVVRGDLWTNWLLLAVRILHWFNPVSWWTVREMQAEREAACDELAFAALGAEADRTAYASTILDLAASLSPPGIAPGMIGLFSSTCRLKARVERLLRSSSVKTLRAPLAVGVVLAVGLLGLTDAMPLVQAQAPKDATQKPKPESVAKAESHTETGTVLDADRKPLAGISVRLYRLDGRTAPPVEVARTLTDAEGRYAFKDLVPPRPENHLDRLVYGAFGFAEGRPISIGFFYFRNDNKRVDRIQMTHESATLSGKVVDNNGKPVTGATVVPYFVFDRPAPELMSAKTDDAGQFQLEGLGVFKWPSGEQVTTSFNVLHPDFPETRGETKAMPAEVVVKVTHGCIVTGLVTDAVSGQLAAGAIVTARRTDKWEQKYVATDKEGRFRVAVPEGRYDFLVDANDRACVAMTGRDCLAGEKVELPPFTLIEGGLIAGQVVNTATGQPVTVSDSGQPIAIGLFGPSQPPGPVISPMRMAIVDSQGRFTVRAAPGENFPYFVNTHGVRMAWDTRDQPPVVVKSGETTAYNMLITPKVPPEEKLKAAQKLVETLSKAPADRTSQILLEFRKLKHTVDETELWCLLMRELVTVGRAAVPQICAELDKTTDDRALRRLAFALRAIGDARAVPALIRALPRSLLPSSSDYGLIVADKDLMTFMQAHDLDKGKGGTHFGLGRPLREIVGAIHALTGRDLNDAELFSMSLSADPRRQEFQRRIYARKARDWESWWKEHAPKLTDDTDYHQVDLTLPNKDLPPAPDPKDLGTSARLGDGLRGAVLSPVDEKGEHAWHFYDLDSGFRPTYRPNLPREFAPAEVEALADWAMQSGADLMCVKNRAADGTESYVLRGLGMKVREITQRDLRNLDRLLAAGSLPEGRPVGELLLHFDEASKQLVPANGAFVFITREGKLGLIEVTDRVTRTADLTGQPSMDTPGVGFHKGVRFNLKAIIP